MQKKRHSALEACISTAIGYGLSLVLNYYVLRLWGFKPTVADASWIAVIFTIASLIRGYYVRRLFNWLHVREIL